MTWTIAAQIALRQSTRSSTGDRRAPFRTREQAGVSVDGSERRYDHFA
ncbi:hypothetical protein [Streptomyces kanasensis]